MRFTEWLTMRENEQILEKTMPDAKQILYTAAVLHKNSQDHLIALMHKLMMETKGTSLPKGWIGRAHHMTIKFRPKQADIEALSQMWGKEVNLMITDWAYDDFGVAVVAHAQSVLGKLLPVANAVPHITVAHSRDVGAVYSNTILANRSRWQPIRNEIILPAFVVGVGHGDEIYPNLSPTPLAVPDFTVT